MKAYYNLTEIRTALNVGAVLLNEIIQSLNVKTKKIGGSAGYKIRNSDFERIKNHVKYNKHLSPYKIQ